MDVYTHTDLAEKERAIQSLAAPWEYIGSKPETLSGVICPQASEESTKGKPKVRKNDSTQVVEKSELDATCREASQKKRSILGGGRTHNLRLRRPTLYPIELRGQNLNGCFRWV